MTGTVYLVGAGPGDPGLVTLRAKALIETADALVYDYLVNTELLRWTRPGCEQVYVGKQAGFHAIPQEEIEKILVDRATAGQRVVRLKGGDPFVFGRGGEEAETLRKHGIRFEIVPGVTAALAGAAYAGVPLTHRDEASAVTFVTGHENPEKHEVRVDFEEIGRRGDTVCIYMGMGHLREIAEKLIAGGRPPETPTTVVRWASLAKQQTVRATLATIADRVEEAGLRAPAVIYVGSVAGEAHDVSWFEERPLFGRRVVITRMREQSSGLGALLREAGAEVLELPLIDVRAKVDPEVEEEIFAGIGTYEWLVFTSANGVRHFFDRFFRSFVDVRSLGLMRIAAIGDGTRAAIRERGFQVDLMPDVSTAEGLADHFIAEESIDNLKFLVITGNLNRDILANKLEEAGGIVDTFSVYETAKRDITEDAAAKSFREAGADAIIFASSSAAKSFVDQAADLQLAPGATHPTTVSIGPQTSETMRALGIPVKVESPEPKLEVLVAELIKRIGQ